MKKTLLFSLLGAMILGQTYHALARGNSTTLPILMVIANQDFHYQEYRDTRMSIEASGLKAVVSAATAKLCSPTPHSGQSDRSDGWVVPDLALSDVEPADYAAIVFVGGWGSSMYQYAYPDPNDDGQIDNFYADPIYNGGERGVETKLIVNDLINDFVDDDKYVAAICHGVTVLAWARVNGQSPLQGKKVATPVNGSPATYYLGNWYVDHQLSVHEQIVANGGFANPYGGEYGDPTTAADDVIVDGKIITAENYDSAYFLGRVLATQVLHRKF